VDGDTADAYFGTGVAEEIANALTKVPGLRVLGRTSTLRAFAPRVDLEPRGVAAGLGVTAILEGTIQRSGDRLRVGSQLTNVSDGVVLWSDAYKRDQPGAREVFGVFHEVARNVASALQLSLVPGPGAGSERVTDSREALAAYLRGRYLADRYTERDLKTAISLYQRAIALDSSFAQPWAGLSEAWSKLADQWLAPNVAYPEAKRAALRAIALDSSLANAHAALALVTFFFDWDQPAAEQHARRAIELDSTSIAGYLALGFILATGQTPESALVVRRRAWSIDPLSSESAGSVCASSIEVDPSASIDVCRRAAALDPGSAFVAWHLGAALKNAGRVDEALAVWRRGPGWGAQTAAAILQAEAKRGRIAEARRLLDSLERAERRSYVDPYRLAILRVALGDYDEAFRWLDRALEVRSAGVRDLNGPNWAPIRSDPRFADILRRAGLTNATQSRP
jgi:TolB-like protein